MITQDDDEFLAGPFQRIEGWVPRRGGGHYSLFAAFPLAKGWSAPNYEVGVFKGRYLNTEAPYSGHKIHWYNDPTPASIRCTGELRPKTACRLGDGAAVQRGVP